MGWLILNNWYTTGNGSRFTYENPCESRSNRLYHNFATYSNKGVLFIQFVVESLSPLNEPRSQKNIGRELKALFGSKTYICIVHTLNGRNGKFKSTVEYYTRLKSLPDQDKMLKVPEITQSNTVEALIVQKDINTKEVLGVYSYEELPFGYSKKREVLRRCLGLEEQGGRSLWTFK